MNKKDFTERVLECEQTLYRVGMSMLKNQTDCEDAVQDTILTAYSKLNTLKNEEYFKTWLVRILINNCNRQLKRRGRMTAVEVIPENAEYSDDNSTEVKMALEKLNPKIRAVIVMRYIEGFSVKEIKEILRIPEGTVKSRLARGRELLGLELSS